MEHVHAGCYKGECCNGALRLIFLSLVSLPWEQRLTYAPRLGKLRGAHREGVSVAAILFPSESSTQKLSHLCPSL